VASPDPLDKLDHAETIAASYRLAEGIYLLGCLETGLTIHNQQLRAHNLAWALAKLRSEGQIRLDNVAVVGAGIGGLTFIACVLSTLKDTHITLLESRFDICPLQQGSDHRWVHPHLYEWPAPGARRPRAEVPVLTWSEGRASDVVHAIVKLYSRYCERFAGNRLKTLLGATYVRIDPDTRNVEWIGRPAATDDGFYRISSTAGDRRKFDAIVVAAGFGLEFRPPGYGGDFYWQNDHLAQPVLDGTRHRRMISGLGDGALIDLSRLTIERFRQDVILEELIPPADAAQFESDLVDALAAAGANRSEPGGRVQVNLYDVLSAWNGPLLDEMAQRLARRLRKDTIAILHAGGEKGERTQVREMFDGHSSVLNRFLLFLLFKCGAFALEFGTLESAMTRKGVAASEVICRFGTKREANVLDLFTEPTKVGNRVEELVGSRPQEARRLWPRGFFPLVEA
jgi:hypothetical protein